MYKKIAKNKINFAIVGCGRISTKHIHAIQRNGRFINLAAFCDIDVKKAEKIKKIFKNAKVYKKFSDLLQDTNINAISICTPSGLHAEMAIATMKAGKDVLIEKPIAMNAYDALRVGRAEKETGRFALPVMQNRFNKPVQIVKNRIKQCGKILQIDASVFWYRPQEYYNDGIHGTRLLDGGVLLNQGIHYVDMINYFIGALPKKVYAEGGTLAHKMECEDAVVVTMKYLDGRVGCLRANTISYPKNFEGSITFFCEKATIKISGTALNRLEYWSGNESLKQNSLKQEKSQDVYGYGHIQVYKNFCDCIGNDKKKYTTVSDALGSIRIIESVYKSLSNGKPITI